MDSLSEIIKTFSEDDVKNFKIFINRQRRIKDRKDFELFSLLLKNPEASQEEIIQGIYKRKNVEAYHGLRKYLTRQIIQFIMMKQLEGDNSAASAISGLLSLSRYLFSYKSYKAAWKYLRKAENLAIYYDLFELLQQVYNLQIHFSDTPFAPELKEIIRKHKDNRKNVEQEERVSIVFSIIRERLNWFRQTGKNIQFDELVQQLTESYDLEQDLYSRPKLLFQVMSVIRSAVIAKKDYYSFEPFLLKHYQKFLLKTGFKEKDKEYKAGILYMISQTLYRNKKFDETQKYLFQLKETLEQMPLVQSHDLSNKYSLLNAATLFFTGEIEGALTFLQNTSNKTSISKNMQDTLNLKLNLAFYHLYQEQPQLANRTLMSISHTNKWFERIMGKEWALKRDLLEMMIQYELGNDDLALNKIRSIGRTYVAIKDNDQYQRVFVFLQLCREVFVNPQNAKTEEFYNRVDTSFDWVPMQQEDLQAVMYYAWFKSKMTGENSYQILLELVKNITF